MNNSKYIISILSILFLFSFGFVRAQAKYDLMKRKGIQYYQQNKTNEAIKEFTRYLDAKPRSADVSNYRGLCYEKNGEYGKSVADFSDAVNLDPRSEEYKSNLDRVTKSWQQELYLTIAARKLEVEADSAKIQDYLDIGNCYKELGVWDYAEKWYDKYLDKDPNAPADVIIAYSEILAKSGSIAKGEKVLEKFSQKYRNDWRILSRLGYFELWLGKFKASEDYFNESLRLKPGFKEAAEGLDLAKSKGFTDVFQPRSFERNTVIDNYYETLKNNPNDDKARFALLDELIKTGRLDEAKQQVLYLQPNYADNDNFKQLLERISITEARMTDLKNKEYQTELTQNPEDREAVKKLAEYDVSVFDFDHAVSILKDYTERVPEDDAMQFYYAQVLTYAKNLDEAFVQVKKAILKNPQEKRYKLLAGQLGVWLDRDTTESIGYLEDILKDEPDNVSALIAMGTYSFHRMDLEKASGYAERAKAIEPENPKLIQLFAMIETQKENDEKEKMWKKLEQAQELVKQDKLEDAKTLYDEVIAGRPQPVETLTDYASLLMKMHLYKNAVTVYDTLMNRSPSSDYDKMRGKAYLLSGDSLKAMTDFERLTKENPQDNEAKLYLADSYAKMEKYEDARKIYKSLEPNAPADYNIEERIDNLPPEPGSFGSFMASFVHDSFSYLKFVPSAYLYTDDLNYDFLLGGIYAETPLNKAITIGGEYSRGNISSDTQSAGLTVMKGSLSIKTSDRTTLGFSYGKMSIKGFSDQPVINGYIKFDDREQVKASLNYDMSDGAAILLSPNLVANRIRTHSIRLDASFSYEDKLKLYGYYNLIIPESAEVVYNNRITSLKNNIGNYFMARLGKSFYTGAFIGYEYFYADFKNILQVYYTPNEFSTHSLWFSWQVTSDNEWEILVGGKLGYAPQDDYVVREGNIKVTYRVFGNFRISFNGLTGNTVRYKSPYKWGALNLSAFWSF